MWISLLGHAGGRGRRLWRDRNPGKARPPRRKARRLKDAARLQRRLSEELLSGRNPNADNPPIAAYVEKWLAQRQQLSKSTQRRYEQLYRYQIKPLKLGRLRLRQCTRDHVREWVATLGKQKRQNDISQTLDAYTVRNAFAVLRAALNTAVNDRLIPFNPCLGVELPRPDDEEVTPLTPDEVGKLLSLVDAYDLDKATRQYRPHRLAALYHVAIRCGLRQGELLGLRIQDYDPKRRELRVAGQLQGGERKGKGCQNVSENRGVLVAQACPDGKSTCRANRLYGYSFESRSTD